jgi:hypothetical protein
MKQKWMKWGVLQGTSPISTGFGGQSIIIPESLWRSISARKYENLDELLTLLKPFDIKTVYSDNNFAYQSRVTRSEVATAKENTCH